jgi:hypothetical protein
MCVIKFKSSHRPDGNIADALASTLACAVLYLWRTCGRDLKFPIAPMGKWLTPLLQLSLAKLRLTLLSTTDCTIRISKFPIAPIERWLTCPNRLSSNRDMYVPATPANFPSPQWETHVLLFVCRAVVSLSWEAQCPS